MTRVSRVRDLPFDTPIFLWNGVVDIVEFPSSRVQDERGAHTWGRLESPAGPFGPGYYKIRGYGWDEMVLYEASGWVRADSLRAEPFRRGRQLGSFRFSDDRVDAERRRAEEQRNEPPARS